jgi:hypothetical protein
MRLELLYCYKGANCTFIKLENTDMYGAINVYNDYHELIGSYFGTMDLAKLIVDLESGRYA